MSARGNPPPLHSPLPPPGLRFRHLSGTVPKRGVEEPVPLIGFVGALSQRGKTERMAVLHETYSLHNNEGHLPICTEIRGIYPLPLPHPSHHTHKDIPNKTNSNNTNISAPLSRKTSTKQQQLIRVTRTFLSVIVQMMCECDGEFPTMWTELGHVLGTQFGEQRRPGRNLEQREKHTSVNIVRKGEMNTYKVIY